jgi:RNA polymerase sigma factor (sigma-70 family)
MPTEPPSRTPTRESAHAVTPATVEREGNAPLRCEQIGVLLGAWQRREVMRVRAFRECAGLAVEDIEDLYQDSVLALLDREFDSEAHLRNALHVAIKHRALNAHRNRHRRNRILERAGRGQDALDHARQQEHSAEALALAQEDRLIVGEFISELTQLETHVFQLLADGLGWRAAADALGRDRNEIRATARACERKRQRFALLYTTGRLCGYRAHTIQALTTDRADSAELAQRARAHLRRCSSCRSEHRVSADRFRAAFEADALALLPLPVLTGSIPLLTRIVLRAHRLTQPVRPTLGGTLDALRAQFAGLLANSGPVAKLAAGAVTVAVGAGGAIGASQALQPPQHRARPGVAATTPAPTRTAAVRRATAPPTTAATWKPATRTTTHRTTHTTRHDGDTRESTRAPLATPGTSVASTSPTTTATGSGFAYLGVTTAPTAPPSRITAPATTEPGNGGAFSP